MRPSAVAVLALALVAAAPVGNVDPAVATILSRYLDFSRDDLGALARGHVIKHTLEASDAREVAAVGAIRVYASSAILPERVRDIVEFKKNPDVIEIGTFSNPPKVEDLTGLTVTKEDVDFRKCRVNDCDIRLPAGDIRRFQREIDWRAPDADARAVQLFKQILVADVQAYISGAPGRITEYDDGKRPILAARDFDGLVRASPFLDALAPGLAAYLLDFPKARLAGAEDFVYWSKERFGLTPFITITHVTIAPRGGNAQVIASNDVYSSRYFDASLSVTIASDVAGNPNAFDLVYVNRSRANALRGAFNRLRRAIVERRAKGSLDENLRAIKARLEQR